MSGTGAIATAIYTAIAAIAVVRDGRKLAIAQYRLFDKTLKSIGYPSHQIDVPQYGEFPV